MASKNSVTLTFAGDATSLSKTFDKIGNDAKGLASDLDSAGTHAKSFGDHIEKAGTHAGNAESKFIGTADVLDGLVTTLGIPGAGAIPFIRGIGDVAGGLDQLTPLVTGTIDKIKDFSVTTVTSAAKSTAAMVTAAATQAAEWVTMGAKATASAARIAAAWIASMGPLGLVVIPAIIAAVALITKYWDQIKAAAEAVKDWIVDRFNDVVDFFKNIPGRIASALSGLWSPISAGLGAAWDAVKGTFGGAISFVAGIPGRIAKVLGGMWDALSSGINTAVGVVKTALGPLITIVDGLRSTIQWIIDHLPGGGSSLTGAQGANYAKTLSGAVGGGARNIVKSGIVQHALGGIFTTPHVGMVAEAGPEAILPLNNPARAGAIMRSAGLGGGNTYHITINTAADGPSVVRAIDEYERRNGRRYARA